MNLPTQDNLNPFFNDVGDNSWAQDEYIFVINVFDSNNAYYNNYPIPAGEISQNDYTEVEDYENEPPLLEGIKFSNKSNRTWI